MEVDNIPPPPVNINPVPYAPGEGPVVIQPPRPDAPPAPAVGMGDDYGLDQDPAADEAFFDPQADDYGQFETRRNSRVS